MEFISISEKRQWSHYHPDLKPRTKQYTAMHKIALLTPDHIVVAQLHAILPHHSIMTNSPFCASSYN